MKYFNAIVCVLCIGCGISSFIIGDVGFGILNTLLGIANGIFAVNNFIHRR